MSEITRVPLQPIAKGSLGKLWIGVAAIILAGGGVAWAALPAVETVETVTAGTGASPTVEDVVLIKYRGRLPDDRADLYDESVDLLMLRWNRQIGADKALLEELGDPSLKLSDVREVLEELAFAVHTESLADGARGDGTADIGEDRLIRAFRPLLKDSRDKAAIVVAVNAWFADAPGRIAKGIADVILPQPQASNPDAAALDRTKQVYSQLQAGRLDRALLTEDAAYYFTPATIADYRTSLSPLGAPSKIEQVGQTRLRGGFVNRSYRVSYPTRTLRISTYAEPGAQGRIEQFLVSPVE